MPADAHARESGPLLASCPCLEEVRLIQVVQQGSRLPVPEPCVLGNIVVRLGIPDMFIDHATQAEQRHDLGLDREDIPQKLGELAEQVGFVCKKAE